MNLVMDHGAIETKVNVGATIFYKDSLPILEYHLVRKVE